jgi:hypothetical protein
MPKQLDSRRESFETMAGTTSAWGAVYIAVNCETRLRCDN